MASNKTQTREGKTMIDFQTTDGREFGISVGSDDEHRNLSAAIRIMRRNVNLIRAEVYGTAKRRTRVVVTACDFCGQRISPEARPYEYPDEATCAVCSALYFS